MHPDSLLCVVEIPRGGRNKYDYLDPDRCSEVIGWDNRVAAFEAIDAARQAFRDNGGY
jgi:hypothetical protein